MKAILLTLLLFVSPAYAAAVGCGNDEQVTQVLENKEPPYEHVLTVVPTNPGDTLLAYWYAEKMGELVLLLGQEGMWCVIANAQIRSKPTADELVALLMLERGI